MLLLSLMGGWYRGGSSQHKSIERETSHYSHRASCVARRVTQDSKPTLRIAVFRFENLGSSGLLLIRKSSPILSLPEMHCQDLCDSDYLQSQGSVTAPGQRMALRAASPR